MLSEGKIIALYCIVDDLLKGMHHYENCRVRVSDSEVITTAFVAFLYFGGHLGNARPFMHMHGYILHMLDKSQFCRRLHRLADLLLALFYTLCKQLKDQAGVATYLLDSFLVTACDNIRISRYRILKGEVFRGKPVAMRRFFFGVRVQTLNGIPVEFCVVPGCEHDSQNLTKLPFSM